MKKLLVLAAVAAMGAMSAKAEKLDTVYFGVSFDGVSNYENYKDFYVLSASDYETWSADSLGSTLAGASWMKVPCTSVGEGNMDFSASRVIVDGGRSGLNNIPTDGGYYGLPMYIVLADGEGYYARDLSADVAWVPEEEGFELWGPDGFTVSGDAKPFGAEPVPEPTSGLLLLLGVAGLALKRQRA